MTVSVVDLFEIVDINGDDDSGVANLFDESRVDLAVKQLSQGVDAKRDVRVVDEYKRDRDGHAEEVVVGVWEDVAKDDAGDEDDGERGQGAFHDTLSFVGESEDSENQEYDGDE